MSLKILIFGPAKTFPAHVRNKIQMHRKDAVTKNTKEIFL